MEICHPAGISQVAAFHPSALPNSVRLAQRAGISVPVAAVMTRLDPFGQATIRTENTRDGHTVRLSFLSVIDLDLGLPLAFVARDRRGRLFLIGASEPPYPEVSKTDSSGTGSADRAAISYEIEWKHLPAIPLCVL